MSSCHWCFMFAKFFTLAQSWRWLFILLANILRLSYFSLFNLSDLSAIAVKWFLFMYSNSSPGVMLYILFVACDPLSSVRSIYVVHWKFSMCTATRTSSYSPVGLSVFFGVFSLGLCFVCSFVLFDLFMCPHSFMFPWAVESSTLQFFALA